MRTLIVSASLATAAVALVFAGCEGEAERAGAPAEADDAGAGAKDATTLSEASTDAGASTEVEASLQLELALERLDDAGTEGGPAAVVVFVRGVLPDGGPLGAVDLEATAPGSVSVGAPRAVDGGLAILVTPGQTSGEQPIFVTARSGTASLTKTTTALVLPLVSSDWGQPEAVPGLVNTAGYEDGTVVSPDGEWLFVGSYSPVDAICCLLGCAGPANPQSAACQTVLGPYGAPERPNMFGAERILSKTRILNRCDKLCFTAPDGGEVESFALPPVTAFGFKRMSDGSFAEPFVIGRDADGCGAPFGFSLLAAPKGTAAEAVFGGYSVVPAGSDNDLFYTPLTLGSPNVLARYSCDAGTVVESDRITTRLVTTPLAGEQGNPQVRAPYIFFDDDSAPTTPKMYVARFDGGLPTAALGATAPLPVGADTDDRRQPFLHGTTLYFAQNLRIATATLSGAPESAASWSSPVINLAGENGSSRPGAVVALGQPTIADRPGGAQELYFVYGIKTATGLDMQAGRVKRR